MAKPTENILHHHPDAQAIDQRSTRQEQGEHALTGEHIAIVYSRQTAAILSTNSACVQTTLVNPPPTQLHLGIAPYSAKLNHFP